MDFVASLTQTLADAHVFKASTFKLIYTDQVIGYTLIYPFEKEGLKYVNIVRLAIDKDHQGQGLGKKALYEIIDWIKREYEVDKIKITVEPENTVAKSLYEKMGFILTDTSGKEWALYMDIKKSE